MYDNPKHIKKHPVKSRYDDFEREHLARAAEKAGEQIATFQRKATLQAIELLEKLLNDPASSSTKPRYIGRDVSIPGHA